MPLVLNIYLSMVDRIKQVIEYSQMSTTVFADTIGVSRSALVHLLTGRNQPSLDVVKKILTVFPEISVDWIMFGKGNMIREISSADPGKTTSAPEIDNYSQIDLFTEYPKNENDVATEGKQALQSQPASQPMDDVTAYPYNSRRPVSYSQQSKREKTRPANDKKIVRIVFFYNDNSFEEFKN